MRWCVALLCALLLSGCGKSGSKHGLSPLAYARRADAVCAPYNAQTARLNARGSAVVRLARIGEQTRVLLERAVGRLRALPLPRGEETRARQWLRSLDRLRRDVVAIRDAARANDLRGVRRLVPGATRDNRRSDALANRLGATTCSKNQG